MRKCILAAVCALLTVSCSEPAADNASCLKRTDINFDKCLEEKTADCTVKRLHEQEECARQAKPGGAPAG